MKYALITGGTRGIGRGITKALLEKGYTVAVTYAHDEEAVLDLKSEVADHINKLYVFKCDQSQVIQTYKLIELVKQQFPYLNSVICNAGTTVRKDFAQISDEDWNSVMNVTLNSHFIMMRDLMPMIQPNSRIIFTGSLMAMYPHGTSLVYGVSKAALHALALNLVKEFEGTNTTVNTIVPGFVDTEWQKDKPESIRQSIYGKTAVKRFAEVKEITQACIFCIDNGFVNGSLLEITGGYSFK